MKEKIKLLTGKDAWSTAEGCGIPSLRVSDGPHGLRFVVREEGEEQIATQSTCYPTLSALGNSFDERLVYRIGQALAEDCILHDVAILLGPGVNLKRTPLCGRNFEYFSEDGVLAGRLAKAYIEGVQSKGVGTSLKHFVANNREYDRFFQSSEIDERTLRETYCRPFEIALEAKPYTVMCSYNPVNGIYASENKHLLRDILRGALGFDGLVVSDWGAVKHRAQSLRAGIDLAMPYSAAFEEQLLDWYQKGLITQEQIDEGAERLRALAQKHKRALPLRKAVMSEGQKHALAVEAATQCAVLLKNDGVLPLSKEKKIAVIGAFSETPEVQGGGSSRVNHKKGSSLHEGLTAAGYRVEYASAYMLRYNLPTPFGYRYATDVARECGLAVVCVGDIWLREKEETDRYSISLDPAMEDLILKVSAVNPNTVVLLYAGSAVDVSAFADRVKGILYMGYGGEGVNEAAVKLLSGEEVPCGKLAETLPASLQHTATGAERGNGYTERYREGVLVGYKYYEYYGIKPAYPFGFGLSYTQFEYGNLCVEKQGDTDYLVLLTVTNTGNYDAREIVQVYLGDDAAMVTRPKKELVRFEKCFLRAGEQTRLSFMLHARDFAYFNPNINDWYVENGTFTVYVGTNSEECLTEKIKIELPAEEQFSQF